MTLFISNLHTGYNKKEVLKGIDFEFKEGLIYGILGRNGAGKTTLFESISGMKELEEGKIEIQDERGRRPLHHEDVFLVSASPNLPDFLTGYEFIKYFIEIKGLHREIGASDIDELFDRVFLTEEDRHSLINTYSFGMKNKVQILCALITRPKIVLLDEPLTSFDIITSHEIKSLLLEMKKSHILLMSTHILQLAKDTCDEIILLQEGLLRPLDSMRKGEVDFDEYIVKELSKGV